MSYMTTEEFLRNAKPCDLIDDLFQKLEQEEYADGPISKTDIRIKENLSAWGRLGPQVFGGEAPMN